MPTNTDPSSDVLETIYTIALAQASLYNQAPMLLLYRTLGSATAIVERRDHLDELLTHVPERFNALFSDFNEYLVHAQREYQWAVENDIQPIAYNDDRYPKRLRECPDAPMMVFKKGNAELNTRHIVSIVGTRNATAYGQDLIRHLMADLRLLCPDIVVVSGLAYGIDICAHRECLNNQLSTIGVLAHGLEYIYPSRHIVTAKEMLGNGALVTEYVRGSKADKLNFVRRNRIVAGMTDATIVVESAEKGGALITARLARDYNREVFAFPGAVTAPFSKGCNNLIRDNIASLITSADDLITALGWAAPAAGNKPTAVERELFPQLTDDEQAVVDVLMKENDQLINVLAVKTGIALGPLTALLFSLEMKGVVRPLAGGTQHLLI